MVLEYWSSKGTLSELPAKYSFARLEWMCEIIFEKTDGFVDVFEVKLTGKKMLLLDLLPYLNEQLDILVPEDAVDCGFRIYRYTKTETVKRH